MNNYQSQPSNSLYQQYQAQAQPQGGAYPQQQQRAASVGPSSSGSTAQLWMGELDPWWDENAIRSIWASFGFNNINVKLIKEKIQQGYNAGYCFIEFPSLELASSALSSNGTKIPNTNKSLKLNWASGAQGNGHSSHNNGSAGVRDTRNGEISIFVGDLAPDVTDTILYEFFGTKYSSVSGTKIMIDQQTGGSKGYGFVRFLNELEQQRALVEMQGAILNGRPIRVSTAVPKNRQQQQGSIQQQQYGMRQQFHPHQQIQSQQTLNSIPQNAQSQQILNSLEAQYQPPLTQFTDPNNTTVFIGGLSSMVTEEELRLYFQPYGDITYVKIPIGKGCGFVQYVTRQSAELAISKMQGYPIGNSRIRLSWGRSNSNPKPQPYQKQPELPLLYGYPQQQQQQAISSQSQFNQFPVSFSTTSSSSTVPTMPSYGVDQIQENNQFSGELSEPNNDQSRLNELYLAAKDGRLDTIDSNSNGYIFA